MKIMRYVVPSMQEGLDRIKKEMGPDAFIIESKKRKEKGLRGYFLPRKLEITAAVDSFKTPLPENRTETVNQNKVNLELTEIKTLMHRILLHQQNQQLQEDNAYNYWVHRLTDNDVDREYAMEIINDIQIASKGQELTREVVRAMLVNSLRRIILTAEPAMETKYLAFIGPTGVGKTTTLAKMAANLVFNQHKKAAIITIDSYRIGAVEQLKIYASITGVPIEVVYSPGDMEQVVRKFQDYDIVLIDTAGRSAKNTMQIAETAQYIKYLRNYYAYLVISAATKAKDLRYIADAYQQINYHGIILTKLDETNTFGQVLNLSKITSVPIVYVTTGQNVPEDIEVANADKLAEMVLGEDLNE